MIINEYLMRIRHAEILSQAESYRLVAQAMQHSPKRRSYSGRALTWLGNRLCKWSEYIQLRFGEAKKNLSIPAC